MTDFNDQSFPCPYCGSLNTLIADFSGDGKHRMITDCETCCRPIVLNLEVRRGEILLCDAQPENG